MSERFKTADADKQRMQSMQPIMDAMAMKYGIDANDIEAIAQAVKNDNALYEDEAARMGLPVETVKQMKQLQMENDRYKAQQAEQAEDRALREHFSRVAQQAEAFKQIVPGFDIRQEMQNPVFARLTGPNGGVSVQDAYFAVHREEMTQAARAQAAQQAAQGIAARVAAGQRRPSENGIGAQNGTQAKTDISTWNRNDYKEVAERVRRGEKIYL